MGSIGLLFLVFGASVLLSEGLEFQHPLLGPLVPCNITQAQGMLCSKAANLKVVVFPTTEQMAVMRKHGFPLPKGFETESRKKRSISKTFFDLEDLNATQTRRKRSVGFWGPEEDIDHASTLNKLMQTLWGQNIAMTTFEPDYWKVLGKEMEMDKNRAFEKFTNLYVDRESFLRLITVLEENLRNEEKKRALPGININSLVDALKLCYYSRHADETVSDFGYERGDAIRFWFHRVSCWRRGDLILMSMSLFYDEITPTKVKMLVGWFPCGIPTQTGIEHSRYKNAVGWWFWDRDQVVATSLFHLICWDLMPYCTRYIEVAPTLTLKMWKTLRCGPTSETGSSRKSCRDISLCNALDHV
jgi:hypothetical protein